MQFDFRELPPNPTVNQSAHLRADGNLQYLKFIDLIKYLWEKGHPDVELVPHTGQRIADRDKAYIIYSLESRQTFKDYTKPRYIETIRDTESDKDIEIYVQMFDNFISFTSAHIDPRVAEEVIETFEDFMAEMTGVFKEVGIGDFFYSRRFSDREDARQGQDVATRTVVYRALIQKIHKVDYERIKSIKIDARVFWDEYDPTMQVVPNQNTITIVTELVDNHATPSY